MKKLIKILWQDLQDAPFEKVINTYVAISLFIIAPLIALSVFFTHKHDIVLLTISYVMAAIVMAVVPMGITLLAYGLICLSDFVTQIARYVSSVKRRMRY